MSVGASAQVTIGSVSQEVSSLQGNLKITLIDTTHNDWYTTTRCSDCSLDACGDDSITDQPASTSTIQQSLPTVAVTACRTFRRTCDNVC